MDLGLLAFLRRKYLLSQVLSILRIAIKLLPVLLTYVEVPALTKVRRKVVAQAWQVERVVDADLGVIGDALENLSLLWLVIFVDAGDILNLYIWLLLMLGEVIVLDRQCSLG